MQNETTPPNMPDEPSPALEVTEQAFSQPVPPASSAETAETAPQADTEPTAAQAEERREAGGADEDVSQEKVPAANAGPADDAELLDALRQVVDPELMINIVDLGLIYEIQREGNTVDVAMTLTSPACPAGPQIMQQSKLALERLESVDEARIRLVMSPPWSPDRMTDDARDQLGIF